MHNASPDADLALNAFAQMCNASSGVMTPENALETVMVRETSAALTRAAMILGSALACSKRRTPTAAQSIESRKQSHRSKTDGRLADASVECMNLWLLSGTGTSTSHIWTKRSSIKTKTKLTQSVRSAVKIGCIREMLVEHIFQPHEVLKGTALKRFQSYGGRFEKFQSYHNEL
jgi:hypothetical protein